MRRLLAVTAGVLLATLAALPAVSDPVPPVLVEQWRSVLDGHETLTQARRTRLLDRLADCNFYGNLAREAGDDGLAAKLEAEADDLREKLKELE